MVASTNSHQFPEGLHLRSAELVNRLGPGLAADRLGDSTSHVADKHRLKTGVAAADQRQKRQRPRHYRQAIEELILWSEHDGRPEDRCSRHTSKVGWPKPKSPKSRIPPVLAARSRLRPTAMPPWPLGPAVPASGRDGRSPGLGGHQPAHEHRDNGAFWRAAAVAADRRRHITSGRTKKEESRAAKRGQRFGDHSPQSRVARRLRRPDGRAARSGRFSFECAPVCATAPHRRAFYQPACRRLPQATAVPLRCRRRRIERVDRIGRRYPHARQGCSVPFRAMPLARVTPLPRVPKAAAPRAVHQ